jgi:ferrochelatase
MKFPAQGIKRVSVICPGFAVDCLETLEEIAIRNREDFMAAGGEKFDYIAALNSDASHVTLLSKLITHHTQGWQARQPDAMIAEKANQLAASKSG